jgi:hypothetical protein
MSFSAASIRTARACSSLLLPDSCVRAPSGLRPDITQRSAAALGLACASFLLGFLPVIFLFSSVCAADILIDSRVGFHGVFRLGRPFPLEIEITNSGRSAEGTVEVRLWKGGATKGGAPYPLLYRKEIFVPAQSRKTVQFTVDPDFISRPLTIAFSSPAGESKQEVDLRRYFSPAPVMLLVSEADSLPPISLAPSSPSRLVSLSVAELPNDPRAWLGISHLILYDQSLRDLSRAQLFALDGWLATGGKMLILGSLNYALYQEPAISRFLPVRVTGAKRVAFTSPLGKSDREVSPKEVWAQASTVTGGKIIAEAGGLPVLVESNRGKGRITYLAFDVGRPPLSQWNGLSGLLQKLLAPAADDDPPPRTRWDDAVFSQLMLSPSFASAYVPTGSLFLMICGYLIGIGTCAWLWQRKRLAPSNLLAVFAAFVTVATFGGYILFSRGGNIPDGVLLSATVIEGSDEGYADAQSNVALFSTQIRPYNLQLEGTWMDLTPVSTALRARPDPTVVLQAGGGSSRYQFELREWDYRLFRMRSVARFPLRAELEPQGDKLLMKIDNQSAKDLTDCWLILPGQRYALGDIPRGATRHQPFPLTPAKANDDSSITGRSPDVDFRDLSFPEKTRDVLFHASFFPRDGEITPWAGGAAAVFFGWVKNPEPRLSVDDPRVQVQEYTLFRTIIPLAGSEDE